MRDFRTRHDYTEHGQKVRCDECDALFRRSRNGTESTCRACRRASESRRANYDDGLSVSERRDVLHRPWRLQEPLPPAPVTTPAVIKEKHPAGCLCGETPDCYPF